MNEKVGSFLSTIREYLTFRDIRRTLTLLIPYMLKYWKVYVALIILLFVDILLTLAFSWFFGSLTDAAIQSEFKRMQLLIPVGIILLIVSLTSTYLNTVYETKATIGVKRDFSLQLYKHILLVPQSDISNHHSGELMSHFTNDIHSIDGVIGRSLLNLIKLPLIYTAVLVYLLQIHWKLAFLCMALAPVALGFGIVFGVILRNNGRMVYRLMGQMSTHLNETFQGLSTIHSFIMETIMYGSYARKNQEIYSLELHNAKLRGWFYLGGQAASTITFLLSLSMGSYYVSIGLLTVGSLLTFVNLVNHLVYPLTELAGQWAAFQRSAAAVERIRNILTLPLEAKELPKAILPKQLQTSIQFQDITFSYDGGNPIFEHLNLQIPAGKVVAIVGLSGAGKTTLFHLLQDLYKPQKGEILIDGRSSKGLLPSELRSLFAHVSQDTFLFDRTIRENLLLAREGITETEMKEAAIIANIHSYINTLPNGYDTEIGERGVRLSGGQKQRLAIARAVLKNAPILLLDEATSALDNETEQQVQEALHRLMEGRTTIVIAHRLSTIQHADVIYVLDKGSIVQIGQHHDLMQVNGKYRCLTRQAFHKRGTVLIISLIQALYDRRVAIPQDESYYEQVLADIEFFDISPQMYWLLKQAGQLEKMPEFFRGKIEGKYRDALYQNMFIRNQMNIVLEQFDAAEIAAIPLKGTRFAEKYFGHLGARATSDIDLLIQPSDLHRAIACVKALGYSFEQERIPSHFHWSFSKVIPGSPIPLTIEIHWDLLKENTSNLSMDQFWKQATPMSTYRYIKELSDYHTFYMICLHGWRHNLSSLKYFIDIIQLIHVLQDSCRYETLFKDAHVHKTLKRITRTLAIVYHQFPHLEEIKKLSLPNRTKLWWDYSTIRNLHQRTIRQYINWVYYQLFDYDNGKQSLQVLLNWKK